MHGLKYDPEFLALDMPPLPALNTVPDIRKYVGQTVPMIFPPEAIPKEVQQSNHSITSWDGTSINVTRFATRSHLQSTTPQSAMIYLFGGGLITGSTKLYAALVADYVVGSGVQFFAVDYRVAPEHPAPAAVEDAFAAVQWLSTHASEFAVDPSRIGVMGDSAGGGVAAGAALLARDRKLSPPLAKQVLVAPMLDDRTITRIPETSPLKPFLFWTMESNKMGWSAYLGADKAGRPEADVSPYTAPGRAVDLSNLPSTYIEVSNLDLFRDEDTSYAARLAAENLDVEFHIWPGIPHGVELIPKLTISQKAMKSRIGALKSY